MLNALRRRLKQRRQDKARGEFDRAAAESEPGMQGRSPDSAVDPGPPIANDPPRIGYNPPG